jgi:hypothetical protein
VNDFVDGGDQLRATHRRLQRGNEQPVVTASLASRNGAGRVSADSIGDEPLARFGGGEIATNLAAKLDFCLF